MKLVLTGSLAIALAGCVNTPMATAGAGHACAQLNREGQPMPLIRPDGKCVTVNEYSAWEARQDWRNIDNGG
jgi:hypothetical protein